MVPVNWFELRSKNWREEREESEAGSGPVREFEERSRRRSDGREGKEGIVPEMLDEERLSSWSSGKDDSAEISEPVEERLRKVLGRDREMTREDGEHVTPCQEHGVDDDDSHEGSRGNGVVGRRESSAFPS